MNEYVTSEIGNAGIIINYLLMYQSDQSAKLMAISTKVRFEKLESVKSLEQAL